MNSALRRPLLGMTSPNGFTLPSARPPSNPAKPAVVDPRIALVSALKNTAPEELKDAVKTCSLHQFLELYARTLLLLVELADSEEALAAGLAVTALRHEASVAVEPISGTMASRTTTSLPSSVPGNGRVPESEVELTQLLASKPHFAVPLRKRITAESATPNRISFGRAPNKDIVLRHSSVSKVHGWFEADEDGQFYIADDTSKNGIWVNARRVGTEPVSIQAGDALRIGMIDITVASPRAMWGILSRAARR